MATAKGIKIPVSLELSNLQSSISTLQNALKDIDPGSSLYKSIERGIEKAKRELNALEVQSKKSFGSQAEINAFEKSFNKTSQGIQEMANSLSKVSFKDLKGVFDEADLVPIKEAGNKIKELQNQIANIKTDKMKELANSSKEFSEQLSKVGGSTFEEAFKNVKTAIGKLNREITKAETDAEAARKRQESLQSKKDAFKTDFTENRFLDKNGNFKGGAKPGKEQLRQYLADVGFSEKDIQSIVNDFKTNFNDIKDKVYNKIQESLNSAKNSYDEKKLKLDANLKQRNEYQNFKDTLSDIEQNPETISQIDSLNAKINEQAQLIKNLQIELAAMSNAAQTGAKAEKEVGDSAEKAGDQFDTAREQATRFASSAEMLSKIKFAIKNWFGFNEVINITKNSVRKMVQSIVELDDVMTQISIVTNMSQDDLWNQMDTYSRMAEQYAVSIKGTYEVSQLFYQQGLQSNQVMQLTEETLKMAKIANLDYAEATDYMTVAIRGFKMEMSDAQTVTDVYSALAASTASDTEELAIAMSKTASSAEAVGSSFESTSAMLATMISITREAPENLGSALKSIISRYGEMTTDPTALIDSEGEAMSLNKVDKALQSVGITLQDVNGQFRDFDDVILELSKKWDTLDANAQRYIATTMAKLLLLKAYWSFKTSLTAGNLVNILLLNALSN